MIEYDSQVRAAGGTPTPIRSNIILLSPNQSPIHTTHSSQFLLFRALRLHKCGIVVLVGIHPLIFVKYAATSPWCSTEHIPQCASAWAWQALQLRFLWLPAELRLHRRLTPSRLLAFPQLSMMSLLISKPITRRLWPWMVSLLLGNATKKQSAWKSQLVTNKIAVHLWMWGYTGNGMICQVSTRFSQDKDI